MKHSLLAAGFAALSAYAYAANDLPGGPAIHQLDLAPAVTEVARQQHFLNNFMLVLCTLIFIAVFAVMFYSIYKHRKSKGHPAASFHESITVEVIWTIIPFLIVIAMALVATKTLIIQKDTSNADLTVKVTGMQWKWGYDYIQGEGEGIGFISTLDPHQRFLSDQGTQVDKLPDNYLLKVDNPLVVPVNKKIRIITTANDVIHSFMVPAFGIKQDAIPGFVRDTWFKAEKTGDYYGQCALLCGKEHSYMPIHVRVVSAQDYTKWVDNQHKLMAAKADDPTKVWTLADSVARGEKVYTANCAICHQPNGKGGGNVKALDGSSVVLNADPNVQIQVVLNGRPALGMPTWAGKLSDTDIAAVISYTKNNWSNHTGQLVQPAQVQAAHH